MFVFILPNYVSFFPTTNNKVREETFTAENVYNNEPYLHDYTFAQYCNSILTEINNNTVIEK